MYVGEKMKELRKQIGLTQYEMADKLSISQAYYSDIERNIKMLSKRLQDKVDELWNVNIRSFSTEKKAVLKNNKKNEAINEAINEGKKPKSNSFRLISLMKGNEAFYIANATAETIKIDVTLNKFFGISMAADHIIEKYLNPLLEISESENIDYKEFIKKYFERLNSYKPFSKPFADFIEAFEKFCNEMYNLGDTYFEIFDKEFIKNELEKG